MDLSCNKCGAVLTVDIKDIRVVCPYCRANYLVEQLITEKRLNNIDEINRLTPIAENAYKIFDYAHALECYTTLIKYDPSETNIARYNICRLAVDNLKPSNEVYDTLGCIADEERYTHLEKIKARAHSTVFKRIRYSIKTNRGIYKLLEIIKLLLWYRKYKWLDLMVRPINCVCGRIVDKGETTCSCSRPRSEIVKNYITRRRNLKLIVVLLLILTILFIIKGSL